MDTKYIFVTGGVVSSLGKGIIAASIGKLLQARGYKITIQKFDPYINIDPGTLNPYEHGECYVTDDGFETDLDLGHYERFTGIRTTRDNSITTGRIYQTVIDRERRGDYLGKTIQVVPHITDEIKRRMLHTEGEALDFVITEVGGTIGDIESAPFMEAIRQLRWELGRRAVCVHLTYVPYLKAADELKTKPTQHSVKELQAMGIQPDILVLRTERHLDDSVRKKVASFCNVDLECVVQSEDMPSIYEVPVSMQRQGLDAAILKKTSLTPSPIHKEREADSPSAELSSDKGNYSPLLGRKATGRRVSGNGVGGEASYEYLLDGRLRLSCSLAQHLGTGGHRAQMHQLQSLALYLFNHHRENLLLLTLVLGQKHQARAVLSLFRHGDALQQNELVGYLQHNARTVARLVARFGTSVFHVLQHA